MIKSEQASLSVTKIAIITIITIFALTVCVFATSVELKNVKIVLSDNCEIEVFTTKTVVSDILKENHIVILPEENVVPNLDSEITDNNSKIVITGITQDNAVTTAIAVEGEGIYLDRLLSGYNTIIEKLIVVEEEVPFETITNDNSTSNDKTERVSQNGVVGLKRVTYKVKFQNDIEIERTLVKEEIIRQPKNKIVNISNLTARSSKFGWSTATKIDGESLKAKVEGITPIVTTLNTSAYAASTCGKSPNSPGYGITGCGAKAVAWYTVASGKGYPIGTIIYIPYFKDKPNGGWFVVQDRGGAITDKKLDVFMNTETECIKFGRRNLECYIYLLK